MESTKTMREEREVVVMAVLADGQFGGANWNINKKCGIHFLLF